MMEKEYLKGVKSFLDRAERDYLLAKNNIQRQAVVYRIQNFLQDKGDLRILLNEGNAGGIFSPGHVEFDFEQCSRILKRLINEM